MTFGDEQKRTQRVGWLIIHSFVHSCMHARIHSLHECELQHSVNRNDDIMLLWGVIMYQHRIGLFRVFLWNKAPVKVMIWVSFSDETWNYNGKKYWEPISLRNSTHAVVLLQICIYIYTYTYLFWTITSPRIGEDCIFSAHFMMVLIFQEVCLMQGSPCNNCGDSNPPRWT